MISDGIETCEGDPCAVAKDLVQQGINLRVNVVGFDVDEKTRAQLQCIADKGNGQYFDAENAHDFQEAVAQAQEIAVTPEPEPEPAPEPVPEPKSPLLYFEDQFDGIELDMAWSLSNPNPDTYLVENGALLMVVRDGVPANYESGENILRLEKPIPKGDWTMTARFLLTPKTMGEIVSIGISKEDENSMLTSFVLRNNNYASTLVYVRADKLANGEPTSFERHVLTVDNRDIELRSKAFTNQVNAVLLRLEKSGRNYISSLKFEPVNPESDGAVSDDWMTVQQLTSLRLPGDAFTIFFGNSSNDYTPAGGEGLLELDWVKIETPQ